MNRLLLILIFSILALGVKAQKLASFCDQEYGGLILKIAESKIDSLKSLGITSIINLNHYTANSEGGYSKILWIQNDKILGLKIEITQLKEDHFTIKDETIEYNNDPEVEELFNMKGPLISEELKYVCDGWMSHQPYFLLYRFINKINDCLTIAQSDIECNKIELGVRLIYKLKYDPLDFYKLMMPELNDKNKKN